MGAGRRAAAAVVTAVALAGAGSVIALRVDGGHGRPRGAPATSTTPTAATPAPSPAPTEPNSGIDAGSLAGCIAEPGAEPGGGGNRRGAPVARIAAAVEKVRGLRFRRPVRPRFLSPAATRRRVLRLFRSEYTASRADADGRLLTALGAIDPTTDFRALLARALGDQVAGFYVPRTGELVVARRARLGALEELTLAHELEHALADQVLALPTAPGRVRAAGADRELAAAALVEGDATLTMQHYAATSLSLLDQLALALDPSVAAALEDIEGLPHYVRSRLEFPYVRGLAFVCRLYARSGWVAVDRAYRRPPMSTAEVLFPGRAPRARPVRATGPGPGPGWSPQPPAAIGAADLLWLFEAPGDDPRAALDDPLGRASQWAGGAARVWTRGRRSAVSVTLAARGGRPSLCASIAAWYRAAWPEAEPASVRPGERAAFSGGGQSAVVSCRKSAVAVGIAPDLAGARRVAG